MPKRARMVKPHGRPKRKDGRAWGSCKKCRRLHTRSEHWSHAQGPKRKGPRGGTSYKRVRKGR